MVAQLRIQDLDTTTSVYLDGIYLPRQYMVDFGTVGFERIEIVKGPQSALFGRNAFLGRGELRQRRAGRRAGCASTGTVGSDDRYDVSGEIWRPDHRDKFGGRVIVAYSEFDGTWPESIPRTTAVTTASGAPTDNLSGWENSTIGVNLEATAHETLWRWSSITTTSSVSRKPAQRPGRSPEAST